jgi:multiple sugar transport system permease protein
VTLFSFLSSWTDFLAPLIFLSKGSLFTLSLGLQQYQSLHFTAFNYLMAAAFVFALPVLLAFIFAQRFFIEGIALTGLRG